METGEESPAIYIEPVEIPVPGYADPAPREPEIELTPDIEEVEVETPVLVPA